MKSLRPLLLVGLLIAPFAVSAQFDTWFSGKTLRMDFFHVGSAEKESLCFDQLLEEPYWGGSRTNLIDTSFFGDYYLYLYDQASNRLLYSRGFCTLFSEWMDTREAREIERAYSGSVVMPFPRNNARIEIHRRGREGAFHRMLEYPVDVNNYFICKERQTTYPVEVIQEHGDPAVKVDIVLLPEGYTAEEMGKFIEDCRVFTEGLFSFDPYRQERHNFNVRAILAPSPESGVDIPGDHIWKNTLLNASFYTFDSERYLMTTDFKSVRNVAANAPYDFIYILANSNKYGGGGIYQHYGLSTTGNLATVKVYVHEFGHQFVGLGDEYVGTTAYNDRYPLHVEPWEPNLTTLVRFASKWEDLLDPSTPIPTPVDRENPGKLGAYEGAGYVAKGMYRPLPDCLMNTLRGDLFCPVCTRAILRQIRFYAE